jgi:hypothetical protein
MKNADRILVEKQESTQLQDWEGSREYNMNMELRDCTTVCIVFVFFLYLLYLYLFYNDSFYILGSFDLVWINGMQ